MGPQGLYGMPRTQPEIVVRRAVRRVDCIRICLSLLLKFTSLSVRSVIPAFLKRGDLVVCDEAVNFAIQTGLELSKARLADCGGRRAREGNGRKFAGIWVRRTVGRPGPKGLRIGPA
jgi:hypothetical protein